MTLSGVASARANSAAIVPPRTTRMRCDIPSTSGSSLETITIAAPRAGQLEHQLVDLGLRADVDAARRLVEEKDARVAEQPLREHDLLLRCRPRGCARAARCRACECAVRAIMRFVGRRARARRSIKQVALDELGEMRERHVLAHGHAEHEPLRLAILGDERDAGRDARRDVAAPQRALAVDRRPRRRRRASAPAIARTISVRPAPIKPANADDLARAHREADAVDERPARADRARRARTGASAATGGSSGKVRVERAPDHRADDLVLRKIARRRAFRRLRRRACTVMRSAMRGSSSMRCEM